MACRNDEPNPLDALATLVTEDVKPLPEEHPEAKTSTTEEDVARAFAMLTRTTRGVRRPIPSGFAMPCPECIRGRCGR